MNDEVKEASWRGFFFTSDINPIVLMQELIMWIRLGIFLDNPGMAAELRNVYCYLKHLPGTRSKEVNFENHIESHSDEL